MAGQIKYRREIDGLRAIAVVPVILYHAGLSIFSGGYVGVDIFFVISGYLITSILITDLERGDFSIARFYERRARRILPALFVVILSCLPFAYLWMLPSQFDEFAQSIIAVVFFFSNVHFWSVEGYFAAASDLKPLLHTWSLAVEEQYYFLFPVFLVLVWRFGRQRVFWALIAIAVLSLLMAEWGSRNRPAANFYLTPTRIWELLVGSICAFLSFGKAQRCSNALSLIGLAMILFAVFAFDVATPFPGLYALAPVVGSALIIMFAGQGTWVATLLSTRAFVGIGLISYSAYLWHQPLFAFARLRSISDPSLYVMTALTGVTLLMAWATWRFIEQPFRKPSAPLLASRRSVFAASLAGASMLVSAALVIQTYNGFPHRLDISQETYTDINRRGLEAECFDFSDKDISQKQDWFCQAGKTNEYTATIAVIGDSHSLSYFEPLSNWGEENNTRVLLNGLSSCPPLSNSFVRRFDPHRDACAARNATILSEDFLKDVDVVVLIARWTFFGFGDISGELMPIGLEYEVDESQALSLEAFWNTYANTVEGLTKTGRRVIVVHQPPVQKTDALSVFQNAATSSSNLEEVSHVESVTLHQHLESYGPLRAQMEQLTADIPSEALAYVDVAPLLCDPICQISRKKRAVYFDDDHLSNYGATLVLPELTSEIQNALGL